MGIGDDILLAMAPLGILTCVVSAIRVGGKKWLKALVGRARESRAAQRWSFCPAPAILSVLAVRERGQPKTKEFIYTPITGKTNLKEILHSRVVYDLNTACEEDIMKMNIPKHRACGCETRVSTPI
ncbi:hypothetical protein BDV19DRAFT_201835 [Aspergillus venezuelensis]